MKANSIHISIMHKLNRTRVRRIVVLLSILCSSGLVAASLKLRPVSDDFCYAQATTSGVWQAMTNWYSTWVGDMSVTFLNTFLVGLPGSISPRLSFIPFIFANLLVAYVAVELFFTPSATSNKFLSYVVFFPLWCTYLWIPALTYRWISGSDGLVNQIAEQSTFWQVVNSSYVVPGCLVVLIFLKFNILDIEGKERLSKRRSLLLVLLGVSLGLSGYVLAISALLWKLTPIAIRLLRTKKSNSQAEIQEVVYLFVSISSGLLISFTSPGVEIRKESLPQESLIVIFSHVPKALILSFMSMAQLLFSVSFLITLIAGYVLHFLFQHKSRILNFRIVLNLLGFLCILSVVNRLSELFSYQSVAHLETSVILVFFLGLTSGALLSQFAESRLTNGSFRLINSITLPIWILLMATSVAFLTHEANGFLAAWNSKTAFQTLPGFQSGWISKCSEGLL